jgi:integrase
MARLTDVQLRAWIKAGKPIAGKSDGNGLTFTLSKAGAAVWVIRYRFGGRQREMTLGRYPEASLGTARKLACKARAEVDQGLDVAAKRQHEKAEARSASTVQAMAEEWYVREIALRYKHPEVVRRVLYKDILPAIGPLNPREVQPRQVDAVLRTMVERGAPTTANDALRYLRRMFAYGRKRRYLEQNPVAGFALYDAGGKEQPRDRALSRSELKILLAAMRETPNLGRQNELAFKILLATCVRKGELVTARWAELDLAQNQGTWHLFSNKTDTPLKIPLSAPVVGWFRELQVFASGSEYVLPARLIVKRRAGRAIQSRFPHISPDTLNVALKRVQHDLEHFTVHDMRRTARTHLAALGVSREVAERALNHKLRGVEGIYNRHDYIEERRHALTLWADLLVSLERIEEAKVISLRAVQSASCERA